MRTPFSPPPGINADDTDFSKVGWSSGSWVRFVNGKEQTRRAIHAAREKPEEPVKAKEPSKEGDGPKSFKEARERAMKRMSEPEGSEPEGGEGEAAEAA